MGFLRNLILGRPDPRVDFVAHAGPSFTIDQTAIAAEVFGLESYADPVAKSPRVSRSTAMQVPAVKRARDLIAGTLGTLPLELYDPQRNRVASSFLDQPEADIPRSVTISKTIADLLFDEVAWWRITAKDYRGYPVTVRRLSPSSVQIKKDMRVYVKRDGTQQGTAWDWVPDDQLIRFDSPNPGLLTAGARAIRTCLLLDAAANRYADGAPPVDYFAPAEGVDPGDDDEITALLDAWNAARKTRSTGYVPAALTYNVGGWNPEQLQLADARQHAVLEISRLTGIDAEELGVPQTSRTYYNAFDRRKTFIDMTVGGYRQAFEDRLGMRDCTPTGFYVKFDLSAFLRSDDLTRMQVHDAAMRLGLESLEEARAIEDKPAPATAAPAQPLRVVPPSQEAAQ